MPMPSIEVGKNMHKNSPLYMPTMFRVVCSCWEANRVVWTTARICLFQATLTIWEGIGMFTSHNPYLTLLSSSIPPAFPQTYTPHSPHAKLANNPPP